MMGGVMGPISGRVHYAPAFSQGALRDGRHFAVAITRCVNVTTGDGFTPAGADYASCRACMDGKGSLKLDDWYIHLIINGVPT